MHAAHWERSNPAVEAARDSAVAHSPRSKFLCSLTCWRLIQPPPELYTGRETTHVLPPRCDVAHIILPVCSLEVISGVSISRTVVGLYAEDTWLYGSSNHAYLGIRAERDGGQGGIIAPSLGVLQRLSPALTLRANYATAFRAPSAEDLYFPGGFGNPQLQPERMRVADFRLSDAAFLGGAALTWFSSFTTNKIVPGVNFVPENIGHASIEGLTFELRTPDTQRMYARLNVTDLWRAVDTASNLRISAAGPTFSISALLGFHGTPQSVFESWGLVADSRGAQYYAFSPDPAPGYTRLDAFVRFRLAANRLLSLRLYNLANHRISDIPGYPEPGATFLLELATR